LRVRKCERCGALITVGGRDVKIMIGIDRSLCEECTRWIMEVVEGG